MSVKRLALCLVSVAAMPLAAGCGASAGAAHTSTSPTTKTSVTANALATGKTSPTTKASATAHPVDESGPSEAAKMICTDETRDNITTVLSMAPDPKPASSWRKSIYTCTYRLPAGPIVLTVHEAASDQAATAYTAQQRSSEVGEKSLVGLNPGAFGTADGVVVLQKDNDTMRVDTSGFSPQSRLYARRAAYAYNIAAVVLGCWTGD